MLLYCTHSVISNDHPIAGDGAAAIPTPSPHKRKRRLWQQLSRARSLPAPAPPEQTRENGGLVREGEREGGRAIKGQARRTWWTART